MNWNYLLFLGWAFFGIAGLVCTIEFGDLCSKKITHEFEKKDKRKMRRVILQCYIFSVVFFLIYFSISNMWSCIILCAQIFLYAIFFFWSKKHPHQPKNIDHLKIQ